MARSTTGKPNPWGRIPPLPADHPLFKRGYVIGMRRSGGSSTSGADPSVPPQKEELPSPMPEEPEDSPNKGLRGSQ